MPRAMAMTLAKCWEENPWNVHGYLLRMLEVVSQDVPGCQHCLKKSSRFMTCTWWLWSSSKSQLPKLATWQEYAYETSWLPPTGAPGCDTRASVPEQTRLVHALHHLQLEGNSCSCDLYRGKTQKSTHLISSTFTCLYLFCCSCTVIFGCGMKMQRREYNTTLSCVALPAN